MKISLFMLRSPRQNLHPASLREPQALEGAQLSPALIALASQNGLTGLVRRCSYKQSRELVQISLEPCFSWPPAFLMPGAAPRRGPAQSLGEETLSNELRAAAVGAQPSRLRPCGAVAFWVCFSQNHFH